MLDNGKRYLRIAYQQKQVRQAIEEVKKMKTSDNTTNGCNGVKKTMCA
jgi:hypothetical protein